MNAPTKLQIINGPDGKPAFVVIPYADFIESQQAEQLRTLPNRAADISQDSIPHAVIEMVTLEDMTPTRAWREHLGLTQAEVAGRIGVTQSAYAQQESAPKNRKATREKIAAALGITADQLDL